MTPAATSVVPPPDLAASAGAEERRANVDGVSIRYLRAGSGPPLLLLHGLLGFSFSWRHNMAELSRVATVYAPDLPGTGYSDRVPMDCSIAALARFMLRFMEVVGIEHAVVAGSSHGGAVVMTMAALDRDAGGRRIDRLVLISPVNPYSPAGRKRIAVLSSPIGSFFVLRSTALLKATRGFFLKRLYGDTRRMMPGTAEGYAAPLDIPGTLPHIINMLKCWSRDLRALSGVLPKIAAIPTLFIWGDRDTAVPLSSAEPLQRHFSSSKLVVLHTAGHLPYEEVPEEFNRVLLQFLHS